MSKRAPREAVGDRPPWGVSAIIYDHRLRMDVGRNHALAEGYSVDDRSVLRGYDRNLHPWIHGRRPGDLVEKFQEVLPFA